MRGLDTGGNGEPVKIAAARGDQALDKASNSGRGSDLVESNRAVRGIGNDHRVVSSSSNRGRINERREKIGFTGTTKKTSSEVAGIAKDVRGAQVLRSRRERVVRGGQQRGTQIVGNKRRREDGIFHPFGINRGAIHGLNVAAEITDLSIKIVVVENAIVGENAERGEEVRRGRSVGVRIAGSGMDTVPKAGEKGCLVDLERNRIFAATKLSLRKGIARKRNVDKRSGRLVLK